MPVAMVARLLGRLQSPAQLTLTPVHCRHTVATGPAQHQLVNSFVGDRSLPTSPARAAEVGDAVDCRNKPRKGVLQGWSHAIVSSPCAVVPQTPTTCASSQCAIDLRRAVLIDPVHTPSHGFDCDGRHHEVRPAARQGCNAAQGRQ